jgi:hypothetical protein
MGLKSWMNLTIAALASLAIPEISFATVDSGTAFCKGQYIDVEFPTGLGDDPVDVKFNYVGPKSSDNVTFKDTSDNFVNLFAGGASLPTSSTQFGFTNGGKQITFSFSDGLAKKVANSTKGFCSSVQVNSFQEVVQISGNFGNLQGRHAPLQDTVTCYAESSSLNLQCLNQQLNSAKTTSPAQIRLAPNGYPIVDPDGLPTTTPDTPPAATTN